MAILHEVKSQVLEEFPSHLLAGYELPDHKLPQDYNDTEKPGQFLLPFMNKQRQAFFHSSDAYSIDELGTRYTWVKLASPYIEALRQAFIASDSRIRIGFERGEDGDLQPISTSPEITQNTRPWLKELTVRGGASFFGGKKDGTVLENLFRFSPDLTCLIGGSMTGKSTLLDGLRIYTDAPLPQDESIFDQVKARGNYRFASGSPDIKLDCPGSDPTASPHERWPAQFFSQNELQRLSKQEEEAVEDILAKLIPSESEGIERRKQWLEDEDKALNDTIGRIAKFYEESGSAEQALARAQKAKQELAVFSAAGVDKLHKAGRDHQIWETLNEGIKTTSEEINLISNLVDGPGGVVIDDALITEILENEEVDASEFYSSWKTIKEHLYAAKKEAVIWEKYAEKILGIFATQETLLRSEIEQTLSDQGLDATKLREIQELNRQATLVPRYDNVCKTMREELNKHEGFFKKRQTYRQQLIEEQRQAFDRVIHALEQKFAGRIRVSRVKHGRVGRLHEFIQSLNQKGITRWWNTLEEEQKPSPDSLLSRLENGTLGDVDMSDIVQETFRERLTRLKKRELASVRCPDRYDLELRMDDGSYRELSELSGGQQVSVLLSLLLETTDDRPLVIDQPEDELDNRFLFETLLPTLKKLKGKRQVILATHNANIVVNGDADMVIQLEATANKGRVACAGAIEEPAVREAIVRTVDGGKDAFRLRRRKYGF